MKSGLKVFGAYHKSMELFDLVAQDMKTLKPEYSLTRWSGYTNWTTVRVSLERLMLKLSW